MSKTRFISAIRRGTTYDALDVILMCSFPGVRMQSYGPKNLIRVDGIKTLLDFQIEAIQESIPHANIIVTTGFQPNKFLGYQGKKIRFVENQLFKETGEVECLRLGLNNTTEEGVLIINGDMFFDDNFIRCLNFNDDCILFDRNGIINKSEVGVNIVKGQGTIFHYNIKSKWCHTVFLKGKRLTRLKQICQVDSRKRMFTFEVMNLLLDECGPIPAFEAVNCHYSMIHTTRDIRALCKN